jgi:protein SCO1
MVSRELLVCAALLGSLISSGAGSPAAPPSSSGTETNVQTFTVKGVVRELATDGKTVVISHDAIPGYMGAMTMPFRAGAPEELKTLRAGDKILFQLHVTGTESWIDRMSKIGTARLGEDRQPVGPPSPPPLARLRHPLLDFKFTNELAQAVSLGDFRGQALAITFFFTRCPIPDFCPRLSKNFEEASRRLSAIPGGPTNWHFLSVSFDPAFDTPPVLRAYGQRYHYDPARWNFLTGPNEEISELARLSGVEVNREADLFNHNFRTLIIDAAGRLQTTLPFSGDLSDPIVNEMLKAAAAGDPAASPAGGGGPPQSIPGIAAGQANEAGKR